MKLRPRSSDFGVEGEGGDSGNFWVMSIFRMRCTCTDVQVCPPYGGRSRGVSWHCRSYAAPPPPAAMHRPDDSCAGSWALLAVCSGFSPRCSAEGKRTGQAERPWIYRFFTDKRSSVAHVPGPDLFAF